ncbi:hypothetical protein VTK26DRAFT_566 [Humicola hyalothermophila]
MKTPSNREGNRFSNRIAVTKRVVTEIACLRGVNAMLSPLSGSWGQRVDGTRDARATARQATPRLIEIPPVVPNRLPTWVSITRVSSASSCALFLGAEITSPRSSEPGLKSLKLRGILVLSSHHLTGVAKTCHFFCTVGSFSSGCWLLLITCWRSATLI